MYQLKKMAHLTLDVLTSPGLRRGPCGRHGPISHTIMEPSDATTAQKGPTELPRCSPQRPQSRHMYMQSRSLGADSIREGRTGHLARGSLVTLLSACHA